MKKIAVDGLLAQVFLAVLLAAAALGLCGCNDYEVKMKYKCINEGTKQCLEWEQSGQIGQSSSCFPAESVVTTRSGQKRMEHLDIGDEVLGLDHATGRPRFTAVRAWLHRDQAAEVEMLVIDTEVGALTVSKKHHVASLPPSYEHVGHSEYVFAEELLVGSRIVTGNGTAARVLGLRRQRVRGVYAPLTMTSNIFVSSDEAQQGSILAHNFANVWMPRRLDTTFHFLVTLGERLFSQSLNKLDESSDEAYVHPIARWAVWLLGLPPIDAAPILVNHTMGGPSVPPIYGVPGSGGAASRQQQDEKQIITLIASSLPIFMHDAPEE